MGDELDGVFDDLTPQDFVRETSARNVAVMEPQTMDEFVATSIEQARIAFHAADGEPIPVAVLTSSDGRRIFVPDDDESLGDYIQRLHREAVKYGATSVFTWWLTQGGAYSTEEHVSVDDPRAMALAREQGQWGPVLYWYCQQGQEVRHGVIPIDAEGNTGDSVESPGAHASAAFRAILG